MMKRVLTIVGCLVVATVVVMGQEVNTQVRIIDSNVKSLKVAPVGNPYMPPIITLGGSDRLNVNFDYVDYDVHYLRYSVTHCNADWQPSGLVESEYVSGFNQADITQYAQSNSTFVHYYNYNFSLPNEEMQLSKSGNYLLTVYDQSDPETVLFQTRFSVCEVTAGVYVNATSRTDADYNSEHQQVSFEVRYKPGLISDPYNELTAIVTQNSREDNAVVVKQPMMVGTNAVTYDHNKSLIFPAGNEYRRIETVNLHAMSMGVQAVEYFEPYFHATLHTDAVRALQPYLYDKTQFGRFTIRNAESSYSAIESEYVVTHFSLFTETPLEGGNIFLQGEFTQGLPATASLMNYDEQSGCYTCDMLLKQGAYNYQYLWVPQGGAVGETSPIEGDKYQTVNEYLVKVYDRPLGERYDHFIGFGIAYGGK